MGVNPTELGEARRILGIKKTSLRNKEYKLNLYREEVEELEKIVADLEAEDV